MGEVPLPQNDSSVFHKFDENSLCIDSSALSDEIQEDGNIDDANIDVEDSSTSNLFATSPSNNVVPQVDGNFSLVSDDSDVVPSSKLEEKEKPNILPVIASYNCRSLMGKSVLLAKDFENRLYQICFLN